MTKTTEPYENNKLSIEYLKKKIGYTVEDLPNFPEMSILIQNKNITQMLSFNQKTQQYELVTITY